MADEKKNSRIYKVLEEAEPVQNLPTRFAFVCDIEASSPSQAIRLVVTEQGGGAYIAVPHGNWTRERYKSEPQPPKITKVEDEATAAVGEQSHLEVPLDHPDVDAADGTLTRDEFEQRKQELAEQRKA